LQCTASLGQEAKPYLKNNLKAKKAQGMAQVIEDLPNKCRALNLNPSAQNKEKSSLE
jgi:hypothetical protein